MNARDGRGSGLHIASRDEAAFADRVEAAQLLAAELRQLGVAVSVVLGIPRGGVIVANEMAAALGCRWDIVIARKLGAPDNPELAVGAVSETGASWINSRVAAYTGADAHYLQQEQARQKSEIERRSRAFRSIRPKIALKDQDVVVTDDGIATGATMLAALRAVRQEEPRSLCMAVPVGAEDALLAMTDIADRVVCLAAPPFFQAVGQFYLQFEQVDDEDVLRRLRKGNPS